jgi:hypothetical protein
MSEHRLAVRWTIGDVSSEGFEALRLSIIGASRLFGPSAIYVVCVNNVELDRAKVLCGPVPEFVQWRDVTGEFPVWLRPFLDGNLAEGVGWKFAPIRLFPKFHELSLDNDCILWEMPAALARWLKSGDACLLAEDVVACFGRFASCCGNQPRNSGIRGLPPGFDLKREFVKVLERCPAILSSELDEQGLQTAALSSFAPLVVTNTEVSICSPFPPHVAQLGTCGAHFVGLNACSLPWEFMGRPAIEHRRGHWRSVRAAVYQKVGLSAGQNRPLF